MPDDVPSSSSSSSKPLRPAPAYATSLLAGAASGLTVDLLFYPIDTLKTRLQSSQGFLAAGGFQGVYRGLGSVAVGSAPGAAAFFVAYEGLKPALAASGLAQPGSPILHMAAASVAEVTACLIRVPTEVVKARQQTSAYGKGVSSYQALRAVLAESGIRGCYRGFAGTVGREIPFTCIQFPLYENLKQRMARSAFFGNVPDPDSPASLAAASSHSLPTWQAGLAGSVAGAVAAGLTTPLDVVKTRIMLERRHADAAASAAATGAPTSAPTSPSKQLPPGVNSKILPTLRHIFSHEGPKALFSGFVPRTLWIGLGGAVFLGVFEAGVKLIEGDAVA